MTYFSPWFLVGFVLGAIAGTFATDLTREEFRNESFKPTRRFWESRQQSLTIAVGVWLILLVTTIIFAGWADLLIGSVIGAAAAPWMWLHFARHFGVEAQLKEAEKKARIEAASYEIYLKEGKPEGRAQAHWDTAKKEVEDTEPRLIEMSGEQELARYRLVSVLLGTALLVATLLPVLKDWLPRAQQFQAFGISLTLATQQANQGRGTPLVPYGSLPNADQGTDRLSEATLAAYKIGAAGRHPPIAGLGRIGPDLSDFVNLSTLDKDRAFIAWLTYELPGNGQLQSSAHSTLLSYIEQAENLLQKNNNPAKWIDPTVDWDFAAGSSLISDCLLDYASEIHDPHLFTVVVGRFLRSFVQEVKNGPSSVQLMIPLSFPGYLGDPLEFPNREAKCDFGSITWGEMDLPHQPPTGASFKISPYPSLIAANYLAAIGAVDTGVLLIEDWIKDFNEKHHKFSPDLEPQLGWYLMRAKLGAGTLPYEFGGLVVPHHQLVRWQADESDQLGRMLRASDPDGWKRLCTKLLPSTLHNNMGQ